MAAHNVNPNDPTEVLCVEIGVVAQRVGAIEKQLERLEVLLMERSGNRIEIEAMKLDVTRAHERIRTLTDKDFALEAKVDKNDLAQKERTDRVQQRQDRVFYMLVGGWAVLQGMWFLMGQLGFHIPQLLTR